MACLTLQFYGIITTYKSRRPGLHCERRCGIDKGVGEMAESDLHRLEARIAALEAQSGGGGQQGVGGAPTPHEWIAGALARSMQSQGGGAGGGPQQQMMANSVTWCTSRFVCATMNCGGSGWC